MYDIRVVNKKNLNKKDAGLKVNIGRPSPLGNPYRVSEKRSREQAVKLFNEYAHKRIEAGDIKIIRALDFLYNKLLEVKILVLVCYCKPEPCHGDVIKELLLNKIHTGKYI